MKKVKYKLTDLVENTPLPLIELNSIPDKGDPVEINGERFYICEVKPGQKEDSAEIGVIPLVIKNPKKVKNIRSYIDCLSMANRQVQFRKDNNRCDLNDCDEMIIL